MQQRFSQRQKHLFSDFISPILFGLLILPSFSPSSSFVLFTFFLSCCASPSLPLPCLSSSFYSSATDSFLSVYFISSFTYYFLLSFPDLLLFLSSPSSSSSRPTPSSLKPPLPLQLFYIFSLFLFLPITLIILPFHLFLPTPVSSPRRVIFHACHQPDVTPEQHVSLCWRSMGPGFHIFSLFTSSFVFIFFYWCGSFDSLASFSNLCCRNTHTLQLCALAGCHRLQRQEEICFHHMLMYSELRAEADRYLFPRGCRESDGDCCYVFITSTLTDELSHHHIEHFCSDLVHKERKTRCLAQLQHEWW